jgi:hypothetical protein
MIELAQVVYLLCALTSTACAWMLIRGYRRSRVRLLFWSSFCFVGLALNNLVLFVDLVVWPDVDLTLVRGAAAIAGFACLLYGLVWESA